MTIRLSIKSGYASLFARPSHNDLEEAKGLSREVRFEVFSDAEFKNSVGTFHLSPMPGCCGVVVSHGVYITPTRRHSIYSRALRDLKEQIAKDLGYGVMLGTTDMSNIPAVGSFLKIYKIFTTFINKRTGHLVGIGFKAL